MKSTPAVRAIPTTYRGVRMRSRLESDTAATLDALGIRWSYETLPIRFANVVYLPDFYLTTQHVWIEAKGPHDLGIAKPRGLTAALDVDPFDHRNPLVVIVRPANAGRLTFEGTGPDTRVALTRCHRCEHYTWADLAAAWSCRVCRHGEQPAAPANPYDIYRSGELPWIRAPRGAA